MPGRKYRVTRRTIMNDHGRLRTFTAGQTYTEDQLHPATIRQGLAERWLAPERPPRPPAPAELDIDETPPTTTTTNDPEAETRLTTAHPAAPRTKTKTKRKGR